MHQSREFKPVNGIEQRQRNSEPPSHARREHQILTARQADHRAQQAQGYSSLEVRFNRAPRAQYPNVVRQDSDSTQHEGARREAQLRVSSPSVSYTSRVSSSLSTGPNNCNGILSFRPSIGVKTKF